MVHLPMLTDDLIIVHSKLTAGVNVSVNVYCCLYEGSCDSLENCLGCYFALAWRLLGLAPAVPLTLLVKNVYVHTVYIDLRGSNTI